MRAHVKKVRPAGYLVKAFSAKGTNVSGVFEE